MRFSRFFKALLLLGGVLFGVALLCLSGLCFWGVVWGGWQPITVFVGVSSFLFGWIAVTEVWWTLRPPKKANRLCKTDADVVE